MAATPIYHEIYLKLKKLIRDGEYEVGDFLPPEGELEKIFNVSRTTVRRVVDILVKEGYIEVKQGRGTKVIDFNSTQKLNGVTSVSETLRKKGVIVTIKSIYIDIVKATKSTAMRLNVDEGEKLYRIQRVQLADGIPIAIIENYINMKFCKDLELQVGKINSLYEFLESEYGYHIDYAKDIISAKSADFTESQMLDVRIGAALLTLRRVTCDNGIPITYDKLIIRADKYRFELDLYGRNK